MFLKSYKTAPGNKQTDIRRFISVKNLKDYLPILPVVTVLVYANYGFINCDFLYCQGVNFFLKLLLIAVWVRVCKTHFARKMTISDRATKKIIDEFLLRFKFQ